MSSTFTLSIFFFNDTATTEIYTLSLHDALPIWLNRRLFAFTFDHLKQRLVLRRVVLHAQALSGRSEEHTSELQSQSNLVCRLLLEKKKLLQHLQPNLRQERMMQMPSRRPD